MSFGRTYQISEDKKQCRSLTINKAKKTWAACSFSILSFPYVDRDMFHFEIRSENGLSPKLMETAFYKSFHKMWPGELNSDKQHPIISGWLHHKTSSLQMISILAFLPFRL